MERGGEGEMYGKSSTEVYITICKIDSQLICCMAQETQVGVLYQSTGVGWGGRWEGGSKGRDICIPMADSHWGLTENNKIL